MPQPQRQSLIFHILSRSKLGSHTLPNLTPPAPTPLKSIRRALKVHDSLVDLFLTVHHKGAILHHLLIQRLPRHDDEPRLALGRELCIGIFRGRGRCGNGDAISR